MNTSSSDNQFLCQFTVRSKVFIKSHLGFHPNKEFDLDKELKKLPQDLVDLTTFYKYQFFGELALINPSGKRTAHCIAIDEVECMFLHRQHLLL